MALPLNSLPETMGREAVQGAKKLRKGEVRGSEAALPSNQSMAALAEGGSSNDTVASPFGCPVALSEYRLIIGRPVFLLT